MDTFRFCGADGSLHDTNMIRCQKCQAINRTPLRFWRLSPIVVFMGDFHQFAPIKAQPLWQTSKNPRAATWHRFTDVVILDEQMRQHDDSEFQALLLRGNAVDKESVIEVLESMYDWIVYDPHTVPNFKDRSSV